MLSVTSFFKFLLITSKTNLGKVVLNFVKLPSSFLQFFFELFFFANLFIVNTHNFNK